MILKRVTILFHNIVRKYSVLVFQSFHNKKWVHIMLEVSVRVTQKCCMHEYIRYSRTFGDITHAVSGILFHIPLTCHVLKGRESLSVKVYLPDMSCKGTQLVLSVLALL